jgi:anti-anti-sigma factor
VPEALRYKEKDDVLYIRAEGHVTAALCADLRFMIFERFDAEPKVKGMYVDLSECTYMDSTFMGLLVGFHKRLARVKAGKLRIVNPTKTARDLLSGLGLLPLIDIVEEAVPFPADMVDVLKTRTAGADLLLKAHENLMELSEDNVKRFSTLHSVLKKQAGDDSSDKA